MTGRVRYGDLMDQAARHIVDVSTLLATRPMADTAEALEAIAAYRHAGRRCTGTAGSCSAATIVNSMPEHRCTAVPRMLPL